MKSNSTDEPIIVLSVNFYRLLLFAYPAGFRKEYGPHMVQLFRDCSFRSYAQDGPTGVLSLWALTLFDFVRSVVEEHLQKETVMNKELFIRLSGWALMLGSILFSLGIVAAALSEMRFYPVRGLYDLYETGMLIGIFIVGPPLIGLGLAGLLVRYGGQVGILNKLVLLIGSICGLAFPLAYLVELLAEVIAQESPDVVAGDVWFTTFILSILLMFGSLTLFGIFALRGKIMPRWNGLPLVAGLWFPILYLIGPETWGSNPLEYLVVPMVLVFMVAMILLGYTLHAHSPEEEPAFA